MILTDLKDTSNCERHCSSSGEWGNASASDRATPDLDCKLNEAEPVKPDCGTALVREVTGEVVCAGTRASYNYNLAVRRQLIDEPACRSQSFSRGCRLEGPKHRN